MSATTTILILILATTIASALPVSNGPSTATASQPSQQYPTAMPFLAPLLVLAAVAGAVVATVTTVRRRRRRTQSAFVPPMLAYHVKMDPFDGSDDGHVLVFGDTVQDLYNQVTLPRGDAPSAPAL
ncbi:hypothetical protein HDU81_003049 [Chytriomyces hyalinus]|nr:hypothetical protein HDU81_003049 [Chytriomyces hyalinus]